MAGPDDTPAAKTSKLLDDWSLQCRRANVAHLRATDSLTWRNYALSVLTAVSSTIVGSSVYAGLQSDASVIGLVDATFAVASLSVIAAALATVQNILRYGTRAEKHRHASRGYGNVMRWIRDVQACDRDDLCDEAGQVRRRLDQIDLDAPNVPADIWIWAVAAVKYQESHPDKDASAYDRHHWPSSLLHARRRRRESREQ